MEPGVYWLFLLAMALLLVALGIPHITAWVDRRQALLAARMWKETTLQRASAARGTGTSR